MLLWIGFAILTAAVIAAIARPLLSPTADVDDANAADLAVYKDQLGEIDADRARGLIGATEAEAARTEVARRMLAKGKPKPKIRSVAFEPKLAAAPSRSSLAAMALVPIAAIGLYLQLGSPGLPAKPWRSPSIASPEHASVEALVAQVEARLAQNPDDAQGWDVIAPVYLRQQRFAEAIDAYRRAMQLLGESPRRLAGFAEAAVIANNGVVSEEARIAWEKVLVAEPGRIEARFWLALAKEQDGKLAAAAADYEALLAAAGPDARWRPHVVERLQIVRQQLGQPAGPFAPSPAKPDRGKGAAPEAQAAAVLEGMAPAEQAKAIGAMVDGLAARLKTQGRDLDGWLRLMRAYTVLGRTDAARTAFADARKAMADDKSALAEIESLARTLGIGS